MTDAIVRFMSEQGYVGVFLLMVAENVFPPIPSEVILPYVGHLSATGEMNVVIALLVSILGSLFGTSFWFLLGWFVSVERLQVFFKRFGGYIAITLRDFEYGTKFFIKHERPAVFLGRMIPGVRSVISIPAGSVHMSVRSFLFISVSGILIWNTLLIFSGYFLLSDPLIVESYIKPISDLILIGFILAYLVQVFRFLKRRED